ncbi:MAG: sigma-70 family RNA polymerase sigma factor [Patescibacteria group bacterium]|nr:sigma-70 family RNA polymerase sigma factor [Patescibacteria group bacterium]
MMGNQFDQIDPRLLIQKARAGDREAFGYLYQRYYAPVFRYVYFRIRRKEDAEDLTETVFLRTYQSIEKFNYIGQEFLAYLFIVARNLVIDFWRRKKELPLDDQILSKEDYPEDELERDEKSRIIHQAIQGLNTMQQEVVILKFIEELPNNEIAKMLGRSEEAIRQIQCRALKALRERLKEIDSVESFDTKV